MIILPSLEIVPAKYNTSTNTLLSQIPIDGTGDFTVTRATSATRVNGNGLIEVAKTNLAFHSEAWSTASNWNLANGVTRATGSTSAFLTPDNTLMANAISPTSGNVSHSLFSNSPTTITYVGGTIYTQSAFIKAGTGAAGRYAQLTFSSTRFSQAGFANFDLQNGTVTLVSGTSADTNRNARIENYGNGWYRCSFTATATGNGVDVGFVFVLITASGDSRVPQFAGTITDVIYGWGAQVEEGSSASEYIPTTTVARTRFAGVTVDGTAAANIPRLDYYTSGGVTGCPALLVEPAVTNLALQSEGFSVSGTWSISNNTQVTANTTGTTDPAGSTLSDLIFCQASGTLAQGVNQSISIATSGTYTMSVFVKKASNFDWFRIQFQDPAAAVHQVYYNLVSGTLGAVDAGSTGTITNFGNGWYRVTHSRSTASGTISFGLRLANANSALTVPCDGISGAFLWGAQLETGSVATSYIPTTVSGVTRAADVITDTTASGIIGQTEGTIYAEVDIRNMAKETYILEIDDGVNVNRVLLRSLTDNKMRGSIVATTSSGTIGISSATFNAGIIKIAFAYKSGDFALSVNGATALTASGTFTFGASLNRVTLGSVGGGGSQLNDRIRAASIYQTRLTNTQLALLTSPYTSYSSMASALSYTLG